MQVRSHDRKRWDADPSEGREEQKYIVFATSRSVIISKKKF